MIIKKILIGLVLLSYALFGLDYHTEGKSIYEPMEVIVVEVIEVPVIPPMSINPKRSVTLKSGWNLVGLNSDMGLNQIINAIGENNLEVIQGLHKTYQKQYVDGGTPQLNDLVGFEKGRGYWIKVKEGVDLDYSYVTYSDKSIILKSGWNLINPFGELTLSQILDKLGSDNVEVIQGFSKTYQKQYVDNGTPLLNDFIQFEGSKGYWLKVGSGASLGF
jgi:hypothetical protein